MNDAGKVAFTPKGDYDNAAVYEYLDTVVFDGNAYAALKTTAGNAPAEGSEYWALLARGGTSIPTATENVKGAVKASEDIGVSEDAEMVLRTDFTEQPELAELAGDETRKIFFGKISKAVSDFITHRTLKATGSVLGHVMISNSSAVTANGTFALAAVQNNASIEGTLANKYEKITADLATDGSEVNLAGYSNSNYHVKFTIKNKRAHVELSTQNDVSLESGARKTLLNGLPKQKTNHNVRAVCLIITSQNQYYAGLAEVINGSLSVISPVADGACMVISNFEYDCI